MRYFLWSNDDIFTDHFTPTFFSFVAILLSFASHNYLKLLGQKHFTRVSVFSTVIFGHTDTVGGVESLVSLDKDVSRLEGH